MMVFHQKFLLCVCVMLIFSPYSFAKANSFKFVPPDSSSCQITASPADTILCSFPQTIQLNATSPPPADSVVWQWSPSTGLSNTSIPNPLATVNGPITYTVQATGKLGTNQVVNGDFEQGNTGFTSSYILDCAPPGGLLATGEYCVTSNPHNVSSNAAFCSDHSTQTGLMMVVNGSTLPSSKVWEETIQTSPDSMYKFTFWAASWSPTKFSLAHFDVIINGVSQGQDFFVSSTDCSWQPFSLIYSPNGSTTADIQIIDLSSSSNGNDFALDDISFKSFCQTSASVTINADTLLVTPSVAALCPKDSVQLNASVIPDSALTITYQWTPAAGLSCTTCPNPIAKPDSTTEYIVTATIAGGCSFTDSVKVIVLDSCPVVLACSVAAGPDTTLCDFPSRVQLHAIYTGTADTVLYQWTPAGALDNPNLQNPVATVTKPIIYIAQAQAIYGVNLIANGNFEQGNTDFATAYNLDCSPPDGAISENEYCITNNPHNVHSAAANCVDHTSGTGLMLVANGDTIPNSNVWEQATSIVPNTTYAFSFWAMNWSNMPALPSFDVVINGIDQNQNFQINAADCDWKRSILIWNSDTNKTADIKIIDLSDDFEGNDFALDDISLQLVCTAKDSLVISRCIADSCVFTQDYDSANTWINHGTGMFIYNDQLHFVDVHGGSDVRITHPLHTLNNNSWKCTFQFSPDSIDPIAGGGVEVISFTSDSGITWRIPPLGNWSANSFIEVDYQTTPHYGSPKTYNLFVNTKLPNDTPSTASDFSVPTNAIQIPPSGFHKTYYCQLQRLNQGLGLFSVFTDSAHSQAYPGSPICFDIPAGIQNLKWLQHGTIVQDGDDRSFTGTVDSVVINNCVQPISFVAFSDAGTSVCSGSKVQLHASVTPDSIGPISYQWNADSTLSCTDCPDPIATPKHNSTYIVTATLPGGCTLTDSVVVKVDSIAALASSSGKIAYCVTDTFQLHAYPFPDTLTGVTYQWSPSAGLSCTTCPNPVATIDSSRTYSVVITSQNGCSAIDSVRVQVLPISLSSQNVNICIGDSVQLFSNFTPDTLKTVTFQWTPSAGLNCDTCPNPFAKPDTTTKYYVTAQTPSGCIVKDSATVRVRTADTISITVVPSAVVQEGDSVQLTATGGFNYVWIPPTGLSCTNCPNPIAKPDTTTTYFVNSIEGNCRGFDSVKITVIPICDDVALPSAFTPNGDGHNDIYKLLYKGDAQLKYFRIYNRWGQEIFDTNDLTVGWDGKYNGKQEPIGTYVWVLDVICHNREIFEKGNVTLIR